MSILCIIASKFSVSQYAYLVSDLLQNDPITQVIVILLKILISIPFGAFLIVLGSIIYPPTGNRLGKYFILTGLMIFTINTLVIK